MIKLIKKRDLLNEALGVPDGLPETAKRIYYDILNIIPPGADFKKLNGLNLIVSGNYRIADYNFNNVNLQINIEENNNFNLLGMGSGNESELGKDLKKNIGSVGSVKNRYVQVSRDLRQHNPYGFDLSIIFSGPKMLRGEHILKYLIHFKNKIVKIIGHELMHLYDFYKNKKRNINKQVSNALSQQDLNINVPTFKNFSQIAYFLNSNENVVRMSEIASGIIDGNITKNEFYRFLAEDDTLNMLEMVSRYKFSDFKNDLLADRDSVLNLFLKDNIIPPFLIGYLKIDDRKYLEVAMDFFKQVIMSGENFVLHGMLNTTSHNYTDAEKQEIIRRQKLKKGKDGEQYFEKMFKKFNFEAEKVLRKIYKLYAMAKDVPNPKIPNVIKKMKNESKWINLDHWDKFMDSQKKKENMKTKNGINKGYIY